MTENFLPFTDEVTVELVHKCIQQLHLLALHFEILGYIPGLLNGLEYLRRTGDFSGDFMFMFTLFMFKQTCKNVLFLILHFLLC